MNQLIIFLFCFILICLPAKSQEAYQETYRPQFHFSAKEGWIGDPCGLTKFDGKYHFFWWGHAVSDDLIHWEERPWPMQGGKDFSYFTGSVVVDKNNTSGFSRKGIPPMVAIYTSAWASGLQNQAISYSIDYENFYYYNENPVLDIDSYSFRDPDVIWHEPTQSWIMSITLSDERKINFYSSKDLKSWNYLSSFGPIGAQQEIWEVPSLVQLPVDGNINNKKWVLLVGMGPNKIQYFPGNFDGIAFHPDPDYMQFLTNGVGMEGEPFCTFEENSYEKWQVEGDAFGIAPASGTLPDQMHVSGYMGNRLINSYLNGDKSIGKLTSTSFLIEKNNISFLIGGGNDINNLCIRLIVDGNVVRQTTGDNTEKLKWRGWNVADLKGKYGKFEITDNATAGWGHILIDHILFSDVLYDNGLEQATWGDFGPDFYAARPYRDYDNENPIPIWQAWMSNWEYAHDVPTSPWKGIQSIPRQLELKTTKQGAYKMYQSPFAGFQKLRKEKIETTNYKITGKQAFDVFQPDENIYECIFTFDKKANIAQDFGINLFVRRNNKVTIGYNSLASNIYFDRTQAGNAGFNDKFPKKITIPTSSDTDQIKFHIFADQSSVEIFINDGEHVISSLVFPYPASTGIEIFSNEGETTLSRFEGWKLTSIWEKDDTAVKNLLSDDSFITIDRDSFGHINVKHNDDKIKHIQISNLLGQVLYTQKDIETNMIKIDKTFSEGYYIIEVQTNRRYTKEKIRI